MATQTFTTRDGRFAVDFDMDHPRLKYAQAVLPPDQLQEALSPDAGEEYVLAYADEHNLTLDEALREVNTGSSWAVIRAL